MTSESFKILKEYCFKIISRREYSAGMIKKKLLEKFPGASSELVKEVLDYLIELNFISDERYTEIFVRNKAETGWGKNKIKFNLKKNGLDSDLIEENLAKINNQSLVISNLIDRKFGRYIQANPDYEQKQKLKQKIIRFLLQRGFSYDEIKNEIKIEE